MKPKSIKNYTYLEIKFQKILSGTTYRRWALPPSSSIPPRQSGFVRLHALLGFSTLQLAPNMYLPPSATVRRGLGENAGNERCKESFAQLRGLENAMNENERKEINRKMQEMENARNERSVV